MSTDTTTFGDDEWRNIDRRAADACVVWSDHRLPPGATPATGRVGIEAAPGGQRRLLVQRGVRYDGRDAEVAAWLATGARAFPRTEVLRTWLAAVLQGGAAGAPDGEVPARPRQRTVDELVDVQQVEVPAQPRIRVDAGELGALLRRQVVGQDLAVEVVAGHVARHVAKSAPRRPLTMLLTGPTGVGKTLLAGVLAEALDELTGAPWALLRIDGNEFAEAHAVSRLVGAPPGYRGHGEGRDLAAELAAAPRSVVLVDEIDKAHPDVLRVLMNLMDAGRLATGAGGGGGDARRAVLVFTSNAVPVGAPGAGGGARTGLVALGVPPEIAARITALVSFAPLGLEGRARVAVLAVRRVAESYGVELTSVDPALLSRLLRADAEQLFGVRTLEYLVERELGEVFAGATADGDVTAALVDGVPPVLRREQDQDQDPDPDPEQGPADCC